MATAPQSIVAEQPTFLAGQPEFLAGQPVLGFSSSRGENIFLSKDLREVSWFPRRSGNYIYASKSLKPAIDYSIEINGSGHVDIGIVTVNPDEISCESRHQSFRRMNEVKVHKRTFKIYIRIETNQVISRYNEEEYRLRLDKEATAWIAIYPKFGEISAYIKGETQMPLSKTHGNNIRLAENDTKAITINKCPAAIAFLNFKLLPNSWVKLQCLATSDGDKKPSRFHLKIKAHRNDPVSFIDDFKGTFDTSVKSISEPPWTGIDSLDRNVCEDTISVSLTDKHLIVCSTDRKYEKKMSLPFDASGGVWLIFELYRVSLQLLDLSIPKEKIMVEREVVEENVGTEANNQGAGRDEIDSVNPIYRGNENAYVDEPNNPNMKVDEPRNPRCRSELSLDLGQQRNDRSSNPTALSAMQEEMSQLKKKVEDLHDKMDIDNMSPKEMLSPSALSPPTNPCKLNFQANLVKILNDLKADDIIDHLFQESIINKNLYDKVLAEKVPYKANRILLRELLDKTVDRIVFERILKDTAQHHLIPLFFVDDTSTKKTI